MQVYKLLCELGYPRLPTFFLSQPLVLHNDEFLVDPHHLLSRGHWRIRRDRPNRSAHHFERGHRSGWPEQEVCSSTGATCSELTSFHSSVLANGVFPAPLITGNKGDAFSLTVADSLTDDTMDLVTSIVSLFGLTSTRSSSDS